MKLYRIHSRTPVSAVPQSAAKKAAAKPLPPRVRSSAFHALAPAGLPNIHQLCSELIAEILHLEDAIFDPDQLKALSKLRHQLADLSHNILVNEINADTAELQAATKALKDASDAAEAAQEDIDKVSEAIKKTAQAIKLASQIVGFVAA